MTHNTDWHGHPIAADETPETKIKWWEVDPHPAKPGCILRERSWQSMLKYVRESLDVILERDGVESDGCSIKFRVVEGTVEQYSEGVEESN
jgi:hypothetical protein